MSAVKKAVKAADQLGVRYLTLYAFSSENWKRPEEEVSGLMGLLRSYLKSEIEELHQENVRMHFIGDHAPLAADIQSLLHESVAKTKDNSGLTLNIALNYGGRAEILLAMKKAVAAGQLDALDEEGFQQFLDTAGMPDPELIIRTSGEQRLSNFLLWQSAYSEFVFLDDYWPEFDKGLFIKALEEYTTRDRRFGGC